MHFTNFEIKNFKGIEHINLPLSEHGKGQIHTLVGLNESGKTTILEAIDAFADKASKFEQVLYEETHRSSSIQDYVPKNKKSNFNDEITIQATFKIENEDKKKIRLHMSNKYDFQLDTDQLGESFTVKKIFKFEDSNYVGTQNLWGINIYGKKKRAQKEKRLTPQDELWRKAIYFIETLMPTISYFPTFLFDFPEKIYLEETKNETKQNRYYRTVIQDILDSLDEGLNVQKHIVDRVHEENSEGNIIFNPFLYFQNKDTKAQIDSVLYKIGDKVSEIIFKTWNEVFERKLKNKSVIIDFGTDSDNNNSDEQKVYLEFYIKDGSSSYSITERSLGFRWFFCFLLFTQFRGFRKEDKNALFLFDEPASNLHSGAQNQLLDSFPKVTEKGCSIIYSTHSHHLINPKWLENTFIIQNLAIDYDNEEEYGASQYTNIKAHKYKTFVGKNPDKLTYFQPILEKLEYRPSALENVPDAIIFEGKHDYYAFSYFDNVIFKNKYGLTYMPGTGANDLDSLISLYKGWGKNFIIMLDGDKAGTKAKQYYQDEWLLGEDQVFTFFDVDKKWEGQSLEKLFSDNDRKKISNQNDLTNPSKCKKAIARYIQEKTLSNEVADFDKETKDNFEYIIKFCAEKIKGEPTKKNRNKKVA
jgi:ABC-type Mn2+/Zn2+ transport system ATPase subunit